jgi:hypothetical protein
LRTLNASKVFLYEPDIIAQIVELVHPEKDVPVEIKSVALYALEAFAHYKGKTAEVASALDARVSHGVLMELVRKTAADLDTAERESSRRSSLPHSQVADPRRLLFPLQSRALPSLSTRCSTFSPTSTCTRRSARW